MMFVMAFVVTADKVIHVVGNVEVGKIVLVQFLLVMNCRSATDDLATKKTDRSVSFDYCLACLLPKFSLVDLLVIFHHPTTLSGTLGWLRLCPCCG